MSTQDLTVQYIERQAKFKKAAGVALNKHVLFGFKRLEATARNHRSYAYNEEQKQKQKLLTEIKNGLSNLERAFAESGGEGDKWVEL